MTYAEVCEAFTAEFNRRKHAATNPAWDLVWLADPERIAEPNDDPDLCAGVVVLQPWHPGREVEVILAPTLEALRRFEPCVFYSKGSVAYGHGYPVAWMFEQASNAVLEIRQTIPAHSVHAACSLAMTWVW